MLLLPNLLTLQEEYIFYVIDPGNIMEDMKWNEMEISRKRLQASKIRNRLIMRIILLLIVVVLIIVILSI
jgi:hypothetical protein